MDATTTFLINVVAAALMGTAIGLERQWHLHSAGLRTNALVAFGACLYVSLPRLVGNSPYSAHLTGQIIVGVGFLGGGVILKEGLNIRGLNTAATMWCSAAVGALTGACLWWEGLVGTAGVLVLNLGLRPVSDWLDRRLRRAMDVLTAYQLRVTCRAGHEGEARAVLLRFFHDHPTMTIQGIATQGGGGPEQVCVVADICAEQRDDRAMEDLTVLVDGEAGVTAVSWKRMPPT